MSYIRRNIHRRGVLQRVGRLGRLSRFDGPLLCLQQSRGLAHGEEVDLKHLCEAACPYEAVSALCTSRMNTINLRAAYSACQDFDDDLTGCRIIPSELDFLQGSVNFFPTVGRVSFWMTLGGRHYVTARDL